MEATEVFIVKQKLPASEDLLLRQTFLHEPDISWSEQTDCSRLYKENADINHLTDFKRQYYDYDS